MAHRILKAFVVLLAAILLAGCAPTPTPIPTKAPPPPTPRATQPPPTPAGAVVVLTPVEMTKKKIEYKAGWAEVVIQFIAENRGGIPFQGEYPLKATVKVREGFTYEATIRGRDLWDLKYNWGRTPIIPPGFRILTPQYAADIGENTTPTSMVFKEFGEVSLANVIAKPGFPTDLPASNLSQVPDAINLPGVARLAVEGFSPKKNVEFPTAIGTSRGDAAFMNVTFQNLNVGQNQELKIQNVAFLDGNGVVKRWDGTVLSPDGKCSDAASGVAFVGLAGTNWPFAAGPGQTRKSQLCIRLGAVENDVALSPNKLKVLLWVNDQNWRVYDTGF